MMMMMKNKKNMNLEWKITTTTKKKYTSKTLSSPSDLLYSNSFFLILFFRLMKRVKFSIYRFFNTQHYTLLHTNRIFVFFPKKKIIIENTSKTLKPHTHTYSANIHSDRKKNLGYFYFQLNEKKNSKKKSNFHIEQIKFNVIFNNNKKTFWIYRWPPWRGSETGKYVCIKWCLQFGN